MASMDAILRVIAKGDASGLQGVTRGLESVKAASTGLNSGLSALGPALGAATGGAVALGVGLGAAGLASFAKNAIDAADNLNDLSQKTGVSVENLSRFQQAASMSGTDIDSVGASLVKLSRNMVEAANTGKGPAAEALRALGISAVDSAGQLRRPDEVMLEIMQRFNQMPDGAKKTALSIDLLGRSGANIIPMLNGGRKSIEELNATVSTDFAQKADAYNDSIVRLGATFQRLGGILAQQFLPIMQKTVDGLTELGIAARIFNLPFVQSQQGAAATKAEIEGIKQAVIELRNYQAEAAKESRNYAGSARLGADATEDAADAGAKSAAAAAAAKQQQEAFKAAVDQSNASYELLGRTIDATAQQVQRQGRLQQETFTADIAINNAAKSILEAKLGQARTDGEKVGILRQIQAIELENARLQRDAAAARIREEVQIADLKRQNAWADLRGVQAALDTAAAMGQQTDQLRQQLALRKIAANEADREYRSAQQIADVRQRANQANYQAQQVQIQSRQITPSSGGNSGGNSGGGGGGPMINGLPVINGRIGMRVNGVPTYATGAYVTQATPAVFGEAGPEYAIPASKMQSASLAYLGGARGAAVLQGGGSGSMAAPRVTIQTGPVIQQPDGSQWVSIGDLEQAMNATAQAVFRQLRTPSARLALGGA